MAPLIAVKRVRTRGMRELRVAILEVRADAGQITGDVPEVR